MGTTGRGWKTAAALGSWLSVCAVSGALQAQAAPELSTSAARELTYQGIADLDAGKYAAALAKLERAYRVVQAPTVALYLARAYEKNRKLVEAAETYLAASRAELDAKASTAFRQAKADAERELDALRSRIPTLTLRVEGVDPESVEVKVDGVLVPPSLVGVAVPVNPGTRKIVASYGTQKVEAQVTLDEGKTDSVELRFKPETQATEPEPAAPAVTQPAPTAPPIANPSPVAKESSNTQAVLGWTALGVGGVGLVVGSVFGLDAMSKESDLKDRCGGTRCPPSEQSAVDDFDRAKRFSSVGFIVGAIGVGGGLTLLLTSSSGADETAQRAPTLRGRVGPGFVGIDGAF